MKSDQLNISCVILTLNEEKNLRACLKTLPAGAEIVVVDSGSDDNTIAIAEEYTDKIYRHDFRDYASQRNFAIKQATRDWVFFVGLLKSCR